MDTEKLVTLAVGIAIGYWVVPMVRARLNA